MPDKNTVFNLAKVASREDREVFEKLRERYKNAVRGYIAVRCFPYLGKGVKGKEKESEVDQNIKEIEQKAWIEAWEKFSTYDPLKGSFYRFTCIWAKIMLKRHFSLRENREIPVSVLKGNLFTEDNEEKSESEILEGLFFQTQQPAIFLDEVLEKFTEYLQITFSQGGPPHQLVVFGFNKLISGWGPKDIVAKLSPSSLQDLSEQLVFNYKVESCLPSHIVEDCFFPLRQKVLKKVKEVLEDENSQRIYVNLLELKVGDTVLKDYYSKDPEHNISDWSNKVKKRVLRLIK